MEHKGNSKFYVVIVRRIFSCEIQYNCIKEITRTY